MPIIVYLTGKVKFFVKTDFSTVHFFINIICPKCQNIPLLSVFDQFKLIIGNKAAFALLECRVKLKRTHACTL